MPATLSEKDAAKLMAKLAESDPAPTTELNYTNTFQLLVAVVLSAQATDKSVNLATAKLFKRITTPEQMARLGVEKLEGHVRSIGLYRTKAKNVIALSKILIAEHDSQVPRLREQLEKLPGVGRKTANVVLNCAFGEHTIAVDTHVFRVSNRTGLAPGRTTIAVENGLLEAVPARFMRHAHHWLILHGRYVCTARKPKCATCLVRDICLYPDKTS